MNEVHAPYHFVPLSKWVYMPDWAHLVSHDVPFKDGYCGVIEYTLTNSTPLCVGDKKDKDNVLKFARNPNNIPIIPGSSLKGMIRNVLEIASFGKLNSLDDHHLTFRDISNSHTRYLKELKDTETQAYWIKFDELKCNWVFHKTEHTVLFHNDLNTFANLNIQNAVEENNKRQLVDAKIKYEQHPLCSPSILFTLCNKTIMGTKKKNVNVECAGNLGKGTKSGYPVFSGYRPGPKEHTGGRLNFSYLFYDESTEVKTFTNSKELVANLFNNHNETLVSYLKSYPHPKLGIPVFAKEDKQGQIVALGFAKMPRKLYDLSTHEVVENTQKLSKSLHTYDLPELMFGTLREYGFSLKSRINFSDALCLINNGIKTSGAMTLHTPKSSYLSAYIEQNGSKNNIVANEFKNYEKGSIIKGWKRYPSQLQFTTPPSSNHHKETDIQPKMEIMNELSQFKGKVVFHNLKKEELGALIWSLQFKNKHGNQSHHSLGHGKPLGAGAVTFSKLDLTAKANFGDSNLLIDDVINAFEQNMNKSYPASNEQGWQESPQLTHLLAFADAQDNHDKNLSYMPLNSDKASFAMSYTKSNKGGEKKNLPDWKYKNEILSRVETVVQDTPVSFAKGRLANLIELTSKKIPLSSIESSFFKEANKLKKENEFAQLSNYQKQIFILKEKLDSDEIRSSKEKRQSCNQMIDDLLSLCIDEKVIDNSLIELISICKDTSRTAYLDLANNKKNKPKLQARKEKLMILSEIQHGR